MNRFRGVRLLSQSRLIQEQQRHRVGRSGEDDDDEDVAKSRTVSPTDQKTVTCPPAARPLACKMQFAKRNCARA